MDRSGRDEQEDKPLNQQLCHLRSLYNAEQNASTSKCRGICVCPINQRQYGSINHKASAECSACGALMDQVLNVRTQV